MATAAGTAVDLGSGDSNRDKWGGAQIEVHNIVDTSAAASDTWTFTTKIDSVVAIVGMPWPEFTWSQSGETVTITVASDAALGAFTSIDLDLLFVGKSVL